MDDYHQKYLKYKRKYLNLKQMHGGKKLSCLRYMIFSGGEEYLVAGYYPRGGFKDFFGIAETLDQAKKIYKNGIKMNHWAHIVDMSNKKIILDSRPGPVSY